MSNLFALGSRLFFSANSGSGSELWKVEPSVLVQGSTVSIRGGNEPNAVSIVFSNPTNFNVSIDGVTQAFNTATTRTVLVDTGGGKDSLTIGLSSLADNALLRGKSGSITSSNYSISFSNVESTYVFGSATDRATFTDPGRVNTFTMLAPYSIMSSTAGGYTNQTIGFGRNTGNGVGNDDSMFLYGDSGNQSLTASPGQVAMTVGTQPLTGNQMRNYYVYGTLSGSGGTDSAVYNGTTADEVLTATPSYSIISSPETLQYLIGFANVTANSGGGVDSAKMIDSAGNDTFSSSVNSATFFGPRFRYTSNGFTRVYAYQTGGNDTATLNGTAGNDRVTSLPAYVVLISGAFIQQAINFSTVIVNAGAGTDSASLDDSSGNDSFRAVGSLAEIVYSGGHKVQLNEFDRVTVRGFAGASIARTSQRRCRTC